MISAVEMSKEKQVTGLKFETHVNLPTLFVSLARSTSDLLIGLKSVFQGLCFIPK